MSKVTVYMHIFPNGKRYIGITVQPVNIRWGLNGSGYKGSVVYNAIQKYGWDNIKHEILFTGLTQEEAEQKERELISFYDSSNREHGYNVSLGGNYAGKHSDATKEKLRNKAKKENLSKETIEKRHRGLLGRKFTKETKIKMKKLAIERWKNDEYRQKVIANRTGIKQSHETVQKRVLKTKGQKRSPEQIARYKKAAKLRSQDPIYKKKLIKGIIEKKAKKVAYIDNDNNVIKVFNSIVECSKYCNITPKYISMVCNGIQEKAKGLKFKFI